MHSILDTTAQELIKHVEDLTQQPFYALSVEELVDAYEAYVQAVLAAHDEHSR